MYEQVSSLVIVPSGAPAKLSDQGTKLLAEMLDAYRTKRLGALRHQPKRLS